MQAVNVKNLCKYYKTGVRGLLVKALDDVSISVKEGEVFGLLGANGAGKSTAIKIMLGLVKPNSGSCEIMGSPLSRAAKKSVGYLPETPNFYKFLTGFELVNFYAKLCGMSAKEAACASEIALAKVGLADAMHRPLSVYSKGMQQRAGLAQAIVHDPRVVILDEPASGLDPIGMADMADIILSLKKAGKTVVLSSHLLGEVEKLCDRVAILSKGRVIVTGSLDALLTRADELSIELKNADFETSRKIVEYAESLGAQVSGLRQGRVSLSEYFKNIVSKNK